MIGAAVNYAECAHDPPESIWDFPVVIQMNIKFYTAPIYVASACICMFISQKNLHKQQCIVHRFS